MNTQTQTKTPVLTIYVEPTRPNTAYGRWCQRMLTASAKSRYDREMRAYLRKLDGESAVKAKSTPKIIVVHHIEPAKESKESSPTTMESSPTTMESSTTPDETKMALWTCKFCREAGLVEDPDNVPYCYFCCEEPLMRRRMMIQQMLAASVKSRCDRERTYLRRIQDGIVDIM